MKYDCSSDGIKETINNVCLLYNKNLSVIIFQTIAGRF